MTFTSIRTSLRGIFNRAVEKPSVSLLHALHITPNQLTFAGLLIAFVAAYLLSQGMFWQAALVFLFSGFVDLLDGSLARSTKQATPFGAVFDSVMDRLAEAAVFLGLLVFYQRAGDQNGVVLCYVAMVTSFMVSYARSRAEGVGTLGAVGFAGRAERIALLCIPLLINSLEWAQASVLWALAIISVLSLATFIQRVYHVWRTARQPKAT